MPLCPLMKPTLYSSPRRSKRSPLTSSLYRRRKVGLRISISKILLTIIPKNNCTDPKAKLVTSCAEVSSSRKLWLISTLVCFLNLLQHSKQLSQLLESSNASLASFAACDVASPSSGAHAIMSVADSLAGIDEALKRYALNVEE